MVGILGQHRLQCPPTATTAWPEQLTTDIEQLAADDNSNSSGCKKSKRQGHNHQDLLSQDVNTNDCDVRSTTSLLESESVYLPVTATTPQRPSTSHSTGHKTDPQPHSAVTGRPHTAINEHPKSVSGAASVVPQSRPGSSPALGVVEQESKYHLKERRSIRPLNQEIIKGKLMPSFAVTLPLASTSDPDLHVCRDLPSTAASHDYDMSVDASRPSAPIPSAVPSTQVTLIHKVADSKRAAREQMLHTPPPGAPAPASTASPATTSIGKSSGKLRLKGLDSNRQAELSKLVKCQQNAERLNQHRSTTPVSNALALSSDSGFLSRPTSEAILTDFGPEGHTAATCIQAMWRGYWAREHDVDVVSVRKEIRARRAEDHIMLLRAELDRHKKLYNEEKRLRTLQMEAIRCLYHEVQQLKSQVHQGGLESGHQNMGHAEIANGLLSPTPTSTTSSLLDSQRTTELERTCSSLQSQVWQLQEALQSMTSVIFRQSSVEHASLTETDPMRMVQVSECLESDRNQSASDSQAVSCHWSSIPHSLSPYPSEEEETYFRQVPHHGAPTPPRSLGLQHKGEHSVLLRWLPSRVVPPPNTSSRPAVTGYQVFVNDQMKGMIGSQQTMALITGLVSTATYKFYVKAVSSQGESYESNIVIARLARGSERQQLSDSSDSDVLPDSDKDRDSADLHDKRRIRKRDARKHRKVRSPRSEKKLPRTGAEPVQGTVPSGREEGMGGEEEGHSAVGILTQPRLHKHRRTSSKEQNELSCLQSDSAPPTPPSHYSLDGLDKPSSHNTPTHTRDLSHTPTSPVDQQHQHQSPVRDRHVKSKSPSPSLSRAIVFDRPPSSSGDSERRRETPTPPLSDASHSSSMSDTFTVDRAKSFLRNLGVNTPDITNTDSHATPDSTGKGHQRKRSKELPSDSLAEPDKERMSPDRGHGISQIDSKPGEEGVKVRTHRRTRSRDLYTPTPMDDSGGSLREEGGAVGGVREKDRCSTPVLDGRRRTSSRPSSPLIVDGEHRDGEATERKRIPTAELLEQRLSSIKKSTSLTNASVREREGEDGESKLAASSAHKHSPSSESLHDSSQDETTRPASLRRRTQSMGSESDLPGVTRKEAGIVSSLLAKLQVFTHKQESNLRETSSRLRKRSDEDDRPRGGRTRHKSESDNDASPDAGGNLPPRAPVSDSSSGSHSDDNKVGRSHRSHHRSPSDQRPLPTSGYNSDQVSSRPTHSPIIMEGASGKKGSSNVRRNASFHALLPSRPPDSQQPAATPEESGMATASSGRKEESAVGSGITSPQESQGTPRSSIRSRSPSPSRSRQPVLSGAQLKRQGDSSKSPS